MKKYEYILVKQEGPEWTNMGSIKSFDDEFAYGLRSRRVASL